MVSTPSSHRTSTWKENEDLKDLNAREKGLLEAGEAAEKAGLKTDRFPETHEEGALAEQLLLEEMDKLSLAEHEKVV